MIKITYLDKHIEQTLAETNKRRDANHKPSGKLSASILGNPLQWQVLKTIGVPQREHDTYTLRKFKRGNHLEDWLRGLMPDLIIQEKFVEYENTVGYVDAIVDMTNWNTPATGHVPHEIKSVTNSAFKWIKKAGYKEGHALQAACYALAMGVEWSVINYVASDDYRILSFLLNVNDISNEPEDNKKTFKQKVDEAIKAYDRQIESGIVPVFEAKEGWQESYKYNNYPEFLELDGDQIEILLQGVYPEQYIKLKN